jgi:hypothetical protein
VKAEDIKLAFRLMAMGRVNHPMVEQLADALANLMETPEQRADAEMEAAGIVKRTRKPKAE